MFPSSADHEQDWQLYPIDSYSAISDDLTYKTVAVRILDGATVRSLDSETKQSRGELVFFFNVFRSYTTRRHGWCWKEPSCCSNGASR